MIGVLCISHGSLAEGMKETAKIFFGDHIENFDVLCLSATETADEYRERLLRKVEEMDQGEGVIILADLLGGTPCNQCVFLNPNQVKILTGMNLAMVMECLAMRQSNMDMDNFVENIKGSICDFSKVLAEKKAKKAHRKKFES